MNLTLLRQTPQLTVYYDSWNNWLFLDWQGHLTLNDVQAACLTLLRCCCTRLYPRVLNSNAHVSDLPASVLAWLEQEFFPHLQLAGVEQIAWVHAASPTGRRLVQQAAVELPQLRISAFDELEQAVEWLQITQPKLLSGCSLPLRLPDQQAQLTLQVQALVQRITTQLPTA